MFQLYKKRNFSDFINDTFQFFKLQGKHYFKNYFTINGGLLLILIVLIYFIFKVYFEFLFANISGGTQFNGNNFSAFFSNNAGLIGIGITAFVLLVIFISLLQFAFPVVYFELYDTKKGSNFSTRDILNGLKSKALKIFKFFIVMTFLLFPLIAVILVIEFLLCFILIGIPMLLITFPAIVSWISVSFFHYLNSGDRLFSSLSTGFDYVRQQFWAIVGSTISIYFMIQIVMSIFTLIPYMFGLASMFTTLETSNSTADKLSGISILMTILMVGSTLFSYILNNLLLVNQGLIYYGQKEANENTNSLSEIDLIGTDSE